MNQQFAPMNVAIDALEALLERYKSVLDPEEIAGVKGVDNSGEPYYALGLLLSDLHFKGVKIPKEYADKIWSITDPDDVEDFTLYLGPRPKA